jgi:hypothetical protein
MRDAEASFCRRAGKPNDADPDADRARQPDGPRGRPRVGAGDYLAKPFEPPRELQARLRPSCAARAAPQKTLRFGRLRSTGCAWCGSTARCTITSISSRSCWRSPERRRVLSRDALMDLLKGEKLEAFDRSVDVHISRIRAAIEDDVKKPRRILTVRGAGYVFARDQDQ